MTTEQLKQYKKIYTDIIVSGDSIENNWQRQRELLPEQELNKQYFRFMPYGAAFASAFVILLVVSVGFVQAAKPGSLLYPVKALTKQLSAKATSTFHANLPNFAPSTIHQSSNTNKNIVLTVTPKPTEQPPKNKESDNSSEKINEINQPEINHKNTQEITEIPSSPKLAPHNDSGNGNSSNNEVSNSLKSVQGIITENTHASDNGNKSNDNGNNDHHGENDK